MIANLHNVIGTFENTIDKISYVGSFSRNSFPSEYLNTPNDITELPSIEPFCFDKTIVDINSKKAPSIDINRSH